MREDDSIDGCKDGSEVKGHGVGIFPSDLLVLGYLKDLVG